MRILFKEITLNQCDSTDMTYLER